SRNRQGRRNLVPALFARQGLRDLRVALRELPRLLLPVDGRAGTRTGMEAGTRQICAGEDRRWPSPHRVRRSRLSVGVASLSLLREPEEMGGRRRAQTP